MSTEQKSTNPPSFRKISKDKYLVAGIITFLIFSLGLTLGFIIENERYSAVQAVNLEQDVNYLSLQLQYLYLTSNQANNTCAIISPTLKAAIRDLSDSLSEVISYEEEKETIDDRKSLIMRRYILDNVRYFLLTQQSQERCDIDILTILYFYSPQCPSCPTQGTILSYFKELYGEKVLIFPINLEFRTEEPMVEILMSQYNITKYPSLVIKGQKYEGVLTKEELQEIICSNLQNIAECS